MVKFDSRWCDVVGGHFEHLLYFPAFSIWKSLQQILKTCAAGTSYLATRRFIRNVWLGRWGNYRVISLGAISAASVGARVLVLTGRDREWLFLLKNFGQTRMLEREQGLYLRRSLIFNSATSPVYRQLAY